MDARSSLLAAMVAAVAAGSPSAIAGGWGGHGAVFHPGVALHGGGGFRGGGGSRGGAAGFAGARRLPPLSGVIHERIGARPYFTAYGHTNTAAPRIGFGRPFGSTGPAGGYGRPYGAAYGHLGTVFRPGVYGGRGFIGRGGFRGGRRFDEARRRFGAGRLVYGGGFGGYGGGFGGYGYGDAGGYGGGGTYGTQGSYGTYGTQSGFGDAGVGQGFSYASETPLAARFAEPPLAPSPYGADDGANGYAYAASEDVGPGPHIITVRHRSADCDCAPRAHAAPTVYRYGVGTAY